MTSEPFVTIANPTYYRAKLLANSVLRNSRLVIYDLSYKINKNTL